MCNAWNHPPGCTCGWGGDGHAGSSYGGWARTPTINRWAGVTQWHERDFTRPSKCPECGEDVFFIRHNGGSVWVDPPLGPPWDKHACFDKPNEPTRIFSTWSAKSAGLTNPKLGIIKRIQSDPRYAEPVIEIELTDSSRVSLILRWTPNDSSMVGGLVFISEEEGLLLHQKHAEMPFHSFRRIPRVAVVRVGSSDWYTCTRCKTSVQYNTGHEEHCRKHHVQPKPAGLKPVKPISAATTKEPRPHKSISPRKPLVVYSARPKYRPIPAVTTTSVPPSQPLRLAGQTLEDRILLAIESIAQKAWEAVMTIQPPDEQYRQAKHKALELIGMLSPSIMRQVGNAFTSAKWQPLLSRRPKHFGSST